MIDEISIFWFRRDLRIEDNTGLWKALSSGYKVLPLFIYDRNILNKLEPDDLRMSIHKKILFDLNKKLNEAGSGLYTIFDTPQNAFVKLQSKFKIRSVYFNRDYEPYALQRDREITELLGASGIPCFSFKDQVIFEMSEVVKNDGTPYTVYTPYSSKWLMNFSQNMIRKAPSASLVGNCMPFTDNHFFSPVSIGFNCTDTSVKPYVLDKTRIIKYDQTRDTPSIEGTSFLGPHLRFGTISIREVLLKTECLNTVFTKELIWREFFMQILYHFPFVEEKSFRPRYDRMEWLNSEENFQKWTDGKTGFPFVDAGMRELRQTGYMHNRVRMVAANFLTRQLLTDWRWGEAWFAKNLFDFDLASNNGNWQWAAGTGCDATPFFRIFNPETQLIKFDPQYIYIKRWIPEFGTIDYPDPIIDHARARERALKHYRSLLIITKNNFRSFR